MARIPEISAYELYLIEYLLNVSRHSASQEILGPFMRSESLLPYANEDPTNPCFYLVDTSLNLCSYLIRRFSFSESVIKELLDNIGLTVYPRIEVVCESVKQRKKMF
jgi:hypothetical protein